MRKLIFMMVIATIIVLKLSSTYRKTNFEARSECLKRVLTLFKKDGISTFSHRIFFARMRNVWRSSYVLT